MNQRNSPLLRLPAELRTRIYDLVFTDTSVHVKSAFVRGLYNATVDSHKPVVGLLCSCRQLYHEALPAYYELCTFDFNWGILGQMTARKAWSKCRLVTACNLPL